MSRVHKFRNHEKLYFISYATVNWIDVFIRKEYKDILVESLKHCIENKGLELYAWCIMTSHVHLIIGTSGDKMEDIVRDMKRHTSKTLLKAIKEYPGESRREWMLWMFERAGKHNPNNEHYQFWLQHNKPIELIDSEMTEQKLNYIHDNPIEAGFVENAWEYIYSSARDYQTENKGLFDIHFL